MERTKNEQMLFLSYGNIETTIIPSTSVNKDKECKCLLVYSDIDR